MTEQLTGLRVATYLSPQLRCDVVPHAFYRTAAEGVVLEVRHLPAPSYSAQHGIDTVRGLGPDLVRDPATVQVALGGSAFSLGWSWAELADELATTSDRVGVPVITDMVPVVHQLRRAGYPTVVAHRLAGVDEGAIRSFLESAGVEIAGVVSSARSAAHNATSFLAEGEAEAAEVCVRALDMHPDAGTLLLLGGSFLTGASRRVAADRGVAFVNNLDAYAAQFSTSGAADARLTDLTTPNAPHPKEIS